MKSLFKTVMKLAHLTLVASDDERMGLYNIPEESGSRLRCLLLCYVEIGEEAKTRRLDECLA
jgi:hypothetical protein